MCIMPAIVSSKAHGSIHQNVLTRFQNIAHGDLYIYIYIYNNRSSMLHSAEAVFSVWLNINLVVDQFPLTFEKTS